MISRVFKCRDRPSQIAWEKIRDSQIIQGFWRGLASELLFNLCRGNPNIR